MTRRAAASGPGGGRPWLMSKRCAGRIAQNAGTSSIHRDVFADDGGVTTVSRTGRLDMAGLAREHALDPVLMFQASMLEDVLQTVKTNH